MREILFRGKSLIGNLWVYGSLVYRDDCENPYIVTRNGAKFFVDSETVGQYTGLEDVNGNKIFEHDIVLDLENEENGVIVFDKEDSM